MAIVRAALRLSAVAALRDRTWAGTRVADSANLPIDQALLDGPAPYITVFTDDDDAEGDGMEADGAGRTVTIVIELGMASPLEASDGGSPVTLPGATDENFELICDCMNTQVIRALLTDSESRWGKIFRGLVTDVISRESKRGGNAEKGARWAARQIILKVHAIADPPPGYVLEFRSPIAKFMTAARAEKSDIIGPAEHLDMIESMFAVAPYPDWRIAQDWLGISTHATREIGIAPVKIPDDVTAPKISEEEINIPQTPIVEGFPDSDHWEEFPEQEGVD